MPIESDPTAVMGRRIGAAAIDGMIAFVPAGIVFASSLTSADAATRQQNDFFVQDADDFCEAYMEQEDGFCFSDGDTVYYTESGLLSAGLVLYAIAIALHVILQGFTGATLGKLATGLRVVDEQGQRAPFWRVLVRWLLWIVDSLPAFGLVGLITAATTTGHRRVGDMVAKTHVVRASAVGTPIGLAAPGAPTFGAPGAPSAYGAAGMPAPTAKPGPQWDEARDTYIQWDPELQSWMQWDDTAKEWTAIAVAPAAPPPPPVAPPPPPPPPPPPT